MVQLLYILCIRLVPYYTVVQDPCDGWYLVTLHLPPEEGLVGVVPSVYSVARYDFVSALQGAARDAALHVFHVYHAALARIGVGEWPHCLEESGSSSTAPPPTFVPPQLVSTSVLPLLPPLVPTFVPPPPPPPSALPPLYPTVPPSTSDFSAPPGVLRGSSSRAVSRPPTPYRRPPSPQSSVQELLSQLDTLKRRCSHLERENRDLTAALRDYTRPGMALNPLVLESSPFVTPNRVEYSIDQQSLATDEPSSQVGAALSSTAAPPLLDPTLRTPLGSPPVVPAPPSPDYTPASPEYTPASPDYTPGLADAVLIYSDFAELDTSLVSSQFTPSDFLRVPSDVTPSEHPLSSVPDSTSHESDAAAPSSPPHRVCSSLH